MAHLRANAFHWHDSDAVPTVVVIPVGSGVTVGFDPTDGHALFVSGVRAVDFSTAPIG